MRSKLSGPLAAIALLLAAATFAQGGSTDEVIWLDEAHQQPYLVPQSYLEKIDWAAPLKSVPRGIPLTVEQAALLRQRIAQQLAAPKSSAALPSCAPAPLREIARPAHGGLTLAAFVESAPIAFVGRVDRLASGWSPSLERPLSQVRLTVETVLRDAAQTGRVRTHAPLSYLLAYGEVQLGKARLCQEAGIGEYTPRAGDRVLVVGYADPLNPGNLHPIGYFEVRDGKVQPRAHAALASHEPEPLSDLVSALDAAKGRD